MIDIVSKVLGNLLQNSIKDVEIKFDPIDSFKPTNNSINLFLFDIRENVELRSNEPIRTAINNNKTVSVRPNLRINCSYLITAWSSGQNEVGYLLEHSLLGQALKILSGYLVITEELIKKLLPKELNNQTLPGPPWTMTVARSDGLKDPSEFWTALGSKLRPSIIATITISLERQLTGHEEAPNVSAHKLRFGERISPNKRELNPNTSSEETKYRISGKVKDQKGIALANATVSSSNTSQQTHTDQAGHFVLGITGSSPLILVVQYKGKQKQIEITVDPNNLRNLSAVEIEL